VTAYCQAQRQCGARIARSALFAALQQPGVQWVALSQPAADLVTDATAAPWPGTITLTIEQEAA
jgi:phage-related baseplate assembly protein